MNGPKNMLWFADYFCNSIGRISTSGTILEWPTAAKWGAPDRMTVGPDGNIWYSDLANHEIVRMIP